MLFVKHMDSQVFPSSSGSDLCDLHVIKQVLLGDSHDQASWGNQEVEWDGMQYRDGARLHSHRKKVINKIMSLSATGGEGPC